jgi:general secretion pathway protein I
LLEVLVALVIAALALAVLFGAVSGGLQTVQDADLTQQAVSRARSHLEGLAGTILTPGVQNGDDGGGFHWQTQISFATAAPAPKLALYNLAVTISWAESGHTRQVRLDSQRLGPMLR